MTYTHKFNNLDEIDQFLGKKIVQMVFLSVHLLPLGSRL